MAKEKFRVESDLLGELQVPAEAYYGVQTQRGIDNYRISNTRMCDYPEYVKAIAYVKWAARRLPRLWKKRARKSSTANSTRISLLT